MNENIPETVDLAAMLDIDPHAPSPYAQVRTGVVDLISRGELMVGQRIPAVRRLAEQLGLAPNTVARSYRELEAAGVIETRGRRGSFIKTGRDATLDAAQRATIEYVRSLRELGLADDIIVTLVTQATSGRCTS